MTLLELLNQKRLEYIGLQGSVGQSQTLINQGWIEALDYVIHEMSIDENQAVYDVPIQGNNAQKVLLDAFGLTPKNLDDADDDFYLAIAAKVAGVHPSDVTSEMRTLAKRMLFQQYLR